MHGQDIPGAARPLGRRSKPDHPALVWDPFEGEGRTLDVRGAAGRRAPARRRPRRPRHRARRQGADPRRELPRDGARVARVRDARRGRGDHQHQVGRRARWSYFVEHRRSASPRSPSRSSRRWSPRPRPDLRWIAVTDDDSGDRRRGAITIAVRRICFAPTRRPGRDAPPSRCCRSGSCSRRARPTGRRPSCTRTRTRCGRAASVPATSTSRTDDRYLIYLPFFHVNAQSWSLLLRARRRRHRGADAEVVDEPLLGRRGPQHGITHISLMPFVIPTLMEPDKPAEHTLRVGVFGLIMPELDADARHRGLRRVRHDRDRHPRHHRQAAPSSCPTRSMGHVTPGYEIARRRQGHRRAVRGRRDRRAVAARHAWHPAVPRVLRQPRGEREGLRGRLVQDRRHGAARRGRQRLLPGARQGPAQGRRRERLGDGGRGARRRPCPGVAQVAVVGKQHDFLDEVVVAFVITDARRTRRRRVLEDQIIDTCAQTTRRLQGAARGLLRRRVPDRHARQDPEEQAAGDGRRTIRRSTDGRPSTRRCEQLEQRPAHRTVGGAALELDECDLRGHRHDQARDGGRGPVTHRREIVDPGGGEAVVGGRHGLGDRRLPRVRRRASPSPRRVRGSRRGRR